MVGMLSIESIESAKDLVSKALKSFDSMKEYAEIRLDAFEGMGVASQNGDPTNAIEDKYFSVGVRVFNTGENRGWAAQGFEGRNIGENEFNQLQKILPKLLSRASKKALQNAQNKARFVEKWGNRFNPAPFQRDLLPQTIDSFKIPFKQNPKDLELQAFSTRCNAISKKMKSIPEVKAAHCSMHAGIERKLFANSIGAMIDQTTPSTGCFVFLSAFGKGPADFYDSIGAYAGLEVLEGKNFFEKNAEDFAQYIAQGTADLSNAPAMKSTPKPVTIVSDPWFNSLVCHEVLGHPSEADRALKRESAWAGRAWWLHSLQENKIGQRVGSKLLNVFSDPTIDGYGHFKYDDEGTLGKRVNHIKDGVLTDFLHSRETAAILGKQPNGGMRANGASSVPLIRMNNTCIAGGKDRASEILEDTRDGFFVSGQKIPSVGETRQNFRISCWKVHEIKNGELGQLYRLGSVMSDSYSFFDSIEAVGNDFRVYNVPNCGKGTPMQTMRVGNGAPTLKSKAYLVGPEA